MRYHIQYIKDKRHMAYTRFMIWDILNILYIWDIQDIWDIWDTHDIWYEILGIWDLKNIWDIRYI